MNKCELYKEQKKVALNMTMDFLIKNTRCFGNTYYTDGVCGELKRALFI